MSLRINNDLKRWDSLDLLRGLSVVGMLLNLNPGEWGKQYEWLIHAKWEGWNLIDMVAPIFLFCIGASMPLSFQKRLELGIPKNHLYKQIALRSLLLIFIGLFFNFYPDFNISTTRIPGVLQRIGLGYGVVGIFVLYLTNSNSENKIIFNHKSVGLAALFILISYWTFLYFVPVPTFGAPRFDPIGSWPSYVDRELWGINHMFKYWPVDGKIVFDPDGLLSTYPVFFNILIGVFTGILYLRTNAINKIGYYFLFGIIMMIISYLLIPFCPIIKNIWTSTFALLSSGFALILLGVFSFFDYNKKSIKYFYPILVFGRNPLIAYIICFLIMPLLDINLFQNHSIRFMCQEFFSHFMMPYHASFLFGILNLVIILIILWLFEKKKIYVRI